MTDRGQVDKKELDILGIGAYDGTRIPTWVEMTAKPEKLVNEMNK